MLILVHQKFGAATREAVYLIASCCFGVLTSEAFANILLFSFSLQSFQVTLNFFCVFYPVSFFFSFVGLDLLGFIHLLSCMPMTRSHRRLEFKLNFELERTFKSKRRERIQGEKMNHQERQAEQQN